MIELVEIAAGVRRATFADAAWLLECTVLETAGAPVEQRSPDGESLLLVLAGTHDLFAGAGSWLRRGLRTAPGRGRPVALFLPPDTPYRLENGTGRAIVFSTRQPPLAEPATPRQALSDKPLLPIAGSGKAFDPETGTWKPKEAFRASPEAILPRRIARLDAGGVEVQRVIGVDYKARGLCVDELSLRAGDTASPPELAPGWQPPEVAVWFEADGDLDVGGTRVTGRGVLRCAGVPRLAAAGGDAYAALAYAGPKPTT